MKMRNECVIKIDLQDFAYMTGISFEGLTISPRGVEWAVIVRGRGPKGKACYAMTQVDDLWEGPGEFLEALAKDVKYSLWRPDKYRS